MSVAARPPSTSTRALHRPAWLFAPQASASTAAQGEAPPEASTAPRPAWTFAPQARAPACSPGAAFCGSLLRPPDARTRISHRPARRLAPQASARRWHPPQPPVGPTGRRVILELAAWALARRPPAPPRGALPPRPAIPPSRPCPLALPRSRARSPRSSTAPPRRGAHATPPYARPPLLPRRDASRRPRPNLPAVRDLVLGFVAVVRVFLSVARGSSWACDPVITPDRK